MAISKWCDTDKWYYDENMNIHSFSLPRNELDEVVIQQESITYNIIQNGCFGQILALKCQDITVINGSDQVPAPILNFSCAFLRGNRVTINRDVRLSHWQTNEFITYEVDVLTLGNNTEVNYAILSMTSGIFNSGTLSTVIIDADSMICSGTTIADSIKPSTITCASGLFTNFIGNGKKTTYNGNFTISSGSIDGSGNGNFIFDNGAINYATINGTAIFSGAAQNYGIIFSDTSFSGSCINYGVIIGKCDFMDNSYNMGIVSGSTNFTSGSYNSGIITGNSLFYSGTVNYGRVSGETSFYYATNEGNGDVSNNTKLYYSTNNGMISGDLASFKNSLNSDHGTVRSVQVDFDNFSSNVGTIGKPTSPNNQNDVGETMQVTFGTGCSNSATPGDPPDLGVVNLNPTGNGIFFTKDSINIGSLNANQVTFGDISKNYVGNQCYNMPNPFVTIKEPDTITAIYSFNKFSKNYCDSIFPSSILVIFNDYSTNIDGTGSIVNAVFNNRSINSGNSIEYGVFNDTSINSGTVTTSGIFNNSSQNGGTLPNSGVFYNSSFNNSSGNVVNGIFRDNSINLGGSGDRLCFCDNSKNSGNCNYLNCELSSINLSGSHTATTAAFSGSSINMESGTCLFTFRGNSINKGILNMDPDVFVNFYDDSVNNNYANYANFYDRSRNSSTSSGISGTFYNKSSNQGFLEQGIFASGSVNNIPGVVIDSVFGGESINYSSMRRSPTYCTGNPCLPVAFGSPAYWFYNLGAARPATTYGYRRIKIMGGAINQANLQNIELSVHDGGINNGNISSNPHGLDDYNPIKLYFTTSGIFLSGITKQYTNTIDPPKLTLTGTILYIEPITNEIFIQAIFCGGNDSISGPAPSIAFTEYSVNNGNIQGYLHYAFSNAAKNYGSLTTFPVIPESHDSASFSGDLAPGLCVNSGYVQGSVTFTDAINYGDLYHAIFNNDSYNFGSIYGSPIDTEYNYGCGLLSVKNEIRFTNSYNYGLLKMKSFFDASINFNTATINSSGYFVNDSINFGAITNNASFTNSVNSGNIAGNIDMTNGQNGGIINGSGLFYDSTNEGIINGGSLFDSSINASMGVLKGPSTIMNYSINSGHIESNEFDRSEWIDNQLSGIMINASFTTLFGVVFDNSINRGVIDTKALLNHSTNESIINKSAVFISSINNQSQSLTGVINGDPIFYNHSDNNSLINGNVIFHTFSNNTASGQIYGNAVFASGSCYSDSNQIYGEITDDGTCQA